MVTALLISHERRKLCIQKRRRIWILLQRKAERCAVGALVDMPPSAERLSGAAGQGNHDQPPEMTIAIKERVDRFELCVCHCNPNQRRQRASLVVFAWRIIQDMALGKASR